MWGFWDGDLWWSWEWRGRFCGKSVHLRADIVGAKQSMMRIFGGGIWWTSLQVLLVQNSTHQTTSVVKNVEDFGWNQCSF